MAMEKGTYQMSLVEKLSFVRRGGTEDELRAAGILQEEIAAAGGESELMDFSIDDYDLETCVLRVTAPYEREVEALPVGLSGSLPEGGVDLKFYYAPRCVPEDFLGIDSLEGYAVLVNRLTFDAYKLLCKMGATAFINYSGMWYDTEETLNMYARNLRPKMLECGKIPGFTVSAKDATELVRHRTETVHLELRQTERPSTSRDVLAVVPGTELPEESIVLTAHFDSVPVGTGSWDNATGAANLMALYRHFVKHPARRTLRFIWCGSEEKGLLGSKAWIAQHEELLPQVKFCFNFDMCGTVLGPNEIYATGGDDLRDFAQSYCREVGWSANIVQKVHSSDSAPFADRGIPALGITRRTDTATIHTRFDLLFPLCPASMADIEAFSTGIITRVADARIVPIPTGMPEDMREKLDKYFQRDKKAE